MSSENPLSNETRRNFLIRTPVRILGVIGALTLSSEAATERQPITTCIETKREKVKSLLGIACEEEIDDPEKRMILYEGLRSAPAFTELADKLEPHLDPNKSHFTFLYPGAGNHIAPLAMAARLIDLGRMDEAEFIYTDISYCKFAELEDNLDLLASIDPDFEVVKKPRKEKKCGEYGSQFTCAIKYRGQPIRINYKLSCSDQGLWFLREDFKNSDVFIQHDSSGGMHVREILQMTMQYINAHNKRSNKAPVIVMEDSTRLKHIEKGVAVDGEVIRENEMERVYSRKFDLELFGTLARGKQRYGHREHTETKLPRFTEAQACRKGKYINEKKRSKWLKAGVAPDRFMELKTETDEANCNNGVVLNMHPELLKLDPKVISAMKKISLNACGSSGYFDLPDLIKYCPDFLQILVQINPKLAEGFSIRIFQTILNEGVEICHAIDEHHARASDQGYQEITNILNTAYSYLSEKAKVFVDKHLQAVRQYIDTLKNNHSLWQKMEQIEEQYHKGKFKEFGTLLKVVKDEWEEKVDKPNKAALAQARNFLHAYGDVLFDSI